MPSVTSNDLEEPDLNMQNIQTTTPLLGFFPCFTICHVKFTQKSISLTKQGPNLGNNICRIIILLKMAIKCELGKIVNSIHTTHQNVNEYDQEITQSLTLQTNEKPWPRGFKT